MAARNAAAAVAESTSFNDGIVRTEQAHTGVLRLASLANSRAIHVNSGIYCLGST